MSVSGRSRIVLSLTVIVVLLTPGAAAVRAATNDTIHSFSLSGTPFAAALPPLPDRVTVSLDLTRRAKVWVSIRRLDGTLVKRLAAGVSRGAGPHTWTWDGRNKRGGIAADREYVARVVAKNARGTVREERPLRKGLPPIYSQNPGAIVIAVDPGHGGRYPGAVRDGYKEKDFNLDIGLKLQALLEHAGVQVVMSRTTDNALDEPPTDHNGDGVFNRYDDDMLRTDGKNLARADVAVHVHNNSSADSVARGTGVFINEDHTWRPLASDLARLMVRAEAAALEAYRSADFDPVNAGVQGGWYYYLGPYDPPFLARPSLVTSVLSESLFVSNPSELRALRRADVRLSIAAGIYIGLAEWLNTRDFGAGYETTQEPISESSAGSAITYHLRLTNRGNRSSEGWTLRLGAVPGVPVYDGSGASGDTIGQIDVPDGLAPGQSVDLEVPVVAPASVGDWLVKADIVLGDGRHFADMGIAALQMPLTTTAP